MTLTFPRPRDEEPFAWGLGGPEPVEIWERFSPAYEAQLQRIAQTLQALGFAPEVGGAGSEDGEYLRAEYQPDPRIVFFQHLEDPAEARFLQSLAGDALRDWIISDWIRSYQTQPPPP